MKPLDMPWGEARVLFELATFARDQSGADGVISVYLKGPQAMLAWHLPPNLYPEMPVILRTASENSLSQLAELADNLAAQLPDEVREKIHEMLKRQNESKH